MTNRDNSVIIINTLSLKSQEAGCSEKMLSDSRLKRFLSFSYILILTVCLVLSVRESVSAEFMSKSITKDLHMRGVWFSYDDYEVLGLSISDNERQYRDKVDRFLEEIQKYRINTIFLHARVSDDAF